MIWNETKECMSRDEMTAMQSARLVKLVVRVYHNVEFYRKKMQEVGLEPGDIRGIEDLTKLPFTTFVVFMQPIHLAIGIVEGIVTGLVLNFLYQNRPDILEKSSITKNYKNSKKKVISIILVAALVVGGGISLLASSNPDGLEWSILKTSGTEELRVSDYIHEKLAKVQNKTAFLLDYGFNADNISVSEETVGKVIAGSVGVIITIGIIVSLSYLFIIGKKSYAVGDKVNGIEDKFKDK